MYQLFNLVVIEHGRFVDGVRSAAETIKQIFDGSYYNYKKKLSVCFNAYFPSSSFLLLS